MHFDWYAYLESVEGLEAPPESFVHVEASLKSLLPQDSVCEVEKDDKVLFCHVKLVSGQLVNIGYISVLDDGEEVVVSPVAEYTWLNLNTTPVFAFGHAKAQEKEVCLDTLRCKHDTGWNKDLDKVYKKLEELMKTKGWTPLTKNIEKGSSPILCDAIATGTQFELQDDKYPTKFWLVSVAENQGGLLGLRYASPDLQPHTDLRLFVTDPRLCLCGTVAKSNKKYEFKVPDSLRALGYPEPVWKVLKSSFSASPAATDPGMVELLSLLPSAAPLLKHGFQQKMLLAAIDPRQEDRFLVCIVNEIIDQNYFKIALLEESDVSAVCFKTSDSICSIPWAVGEGLLDRNSLENMACSPQSKIASKYLFPAHSTKYPGLEAGQYLEFMTHTWPLTLNIAKILEVKQHILKLEVLMECGETRNIVVSAGSRRIFPAGWAASNSIFIKVPERLHGFCESDEEKEVLVPEEKISVVPDKCEHSKAVLKGYWCPPIYFNHQCYSASFLRKQRLEALPQFIGPGPVRLVMREVLSRLVGSSFKSGAVLKKLEVGESRRPHFWLETMKGKSRVLLLEGRVEVPERAEQVTEFCREVCQKLECCPYLFGPVRVGGECPSACQTRPKHEFLLETSRSKNKGRRGGGKKRHRKPEEQNGGEDKNGGEDSSSDETESATPSCSNTRDPSRETSPDRESGPPLKKRAVTQLKVEPTPKEMEDLEELLEESLRDDTPSPPIRPPSPKFLRSRKPKPATPPSPSTSLITTSPPQLNGVSYAEDPDPLLFGRGVELEPAFRYEDLVAPPRPMMEPPPVYRIRLKSNPVDWTSDEVSQYIHSQKEQEISQLAQAFKHEQIDGPAFLLLNLPTILDHWRIKFSTAYTLCRLIEGVKLAFYLQFAHRTPSA
jgi:hypothetical protein